MRKINLRSLTALAHARGWIDNTFLGAWSSQCRGWCSVSYEGYLDLAIDIGRWLLRSGTGTVRPEDYVTPAPTVLHREFVITFG